MGHDDKPFANPYGRTTAVKNDIFDKIMPKMSGNGFKILMVAYRQTWGWVDDSTPSGRKEKDVISYSQFKEKTGIGSFTTVSRALSECLDAGYLSRRQVGVHRGTGKPIYEYWLNRDYQFPATTESVVDDTPERAATGSTTESVVGDAPERASTSPTTEIGVGATPKSEVARSATETGVADKGTTESVAGATTLSVAGATTESVVTKTKKNNQTKRDDDDVGVYQLQNEPDANSLLRDNGRESREESNLIGAGNSPAANLLLFLGQEQNDPLDWNLARALVEPYTWEQVVQTIHYARSASRLRSPLGYVINALRAGTLPMVVLNPAEREQYQAGVHLCPGECARFYWADELCGECHRCRVDCCTCTRSKEPGHRVAASRRHGPKQTDSSSPTTPNEIWQAALGELELQMTRETFNTWIKPTVMLRREGYTFVVGVENDHVKAWLRNRLLSTIQRTVTSIVGHAVEVEFVVWTKEPAGDPAAAGN
jgi:hypothetical protein